MIWTGIIEPGVDQTTVRPLTLGNSPVASARTNEDEVNPHLASDPKGEWSGGKSGLHWAGCQVTPGGREPTASATENKPPVTYPCYARKACSTAGVDAAFRVAVSASRVGDG